MQIEVITEGIWSRFGDEAPIFGSAEQLALHDLAMVKPAILYGSHVTLRTGNLFTRSQVSGLRARLTMPLQAVLGAARLAREPSIRSHLVEATEMSESDLLSASACEEFVRRHEGHVADDPIPLVIEWAGQMGSSLDNTIRALHIALQQEADRLVHSDLEIAVDAGLLTIQPHTQDVPPVFDTVGDYLSSEPPEEYLTRALFEVMEILQESATTCMLDPWSFEVARQMPAAGISRTALSAELGMHLLSGLPSVQRGSLREIVDLRDELRAPLVRFRAAMVEAAEEFDSAPDDLDVEEFIGTYSTKVVQPAILEIETAVHENTYVGELLRSALDPKDLTIFGGSLVVAATSALPPAQLVAAAVGLGVPALRAWHERQRQARRIERHKFFLLHAVERQQ